MNPSADAEIKTTHAHDEIEHVRRMVQSCIQCGTCTGSCPNAFAMDLTPRQLWQHVLLGRREAVFHSRTFTLCSACYFCTLRCPRGLHLTEAMHALKQAAARERLPLYRPVTAFFRHFMESVRRHGRVNEAGVHDPLLCRDEEPSAAPAVFGPRNAAGGQGQTAPAVAACGENGRWRRCFRKAAELEEGR